MALAPVQQISTPLEDYAGYWLKFYKQGTTTPVTNGIAIDSTGDTTVAKAEISSGGTVPIGFIKTTGDVIFIPYIDEAYDAWLFSTEALADANDTSTPAVQIANDVFIQTLTSNVFYAENYSSLALAVTAAAGKELVISTNITSDTSQTISGLTLRFVQGGNLDPDSGVTLTLNCNIHAGHYVIFDTTAAGTIALGVKARKLKAGWFGDTRDDVTLNALITELGAVNSYDVEFQTGTWTLANNVTFTENYHIDIPFGCLISPNTTKTFRNEGSMEAGVYQIYTGAGTSTGPFADGFTWPHWYGMKEGATGTVNSTALQAAIDTRLSVRVAGGGYDFATTITAVTGVFQILGFGGKGQNDASRPSFNYTGSGIFIDITNNSNSSAYIENIRFTGGPDDGSQCIKSYRPLSTFKDLYFDEYDGGGILLGEHGSNSDVSGWTSLIQDCRYLGPSSATAYIGYDIDVNGGNIKLVRAHASRGDIGINLQRGEDIRLDACNIEKQNSSFGTTHKSCIRFPSAVNKEIKNVRITSGYLEGFVNGIYVEKVRNLSIDSVLINDLATGLRHIYIDSNLVDHIAIKNCFIVVFAGTGIEINSNVDQSKIVLENNYYRQDGKTITGATQDNPVVITASNGYSDNDIVTIDDVVGMTELNGNTYVVASASGTAFSLHDFAGNTINSTGFTAYSSGGQSEKHLPLTNTGNMPVTSIQGHQQTAGALISEQNTETLAGTKTLKADDVDVQFLDADGSNRNVDLSPEEFSIGKRFEIYNTETSAGNLVVRNDAAGTIITIAPNEAGIVRCNGTIWRGFIGGVT